MSTPTHGRSDSVAVEVSQAQVQRILTSTTFRNSITLQQLLHFLAAKAFEPGADALKEYTIGVEAFGRSADFDPKTDTIVRVQIHRLRQKLSEYYESEGRRDPILVEIPKGHYVPTFEAAASTETSLAGSTVASLAGVNKVDSESVKSNQEAGHKNDRAPLSVWPRIGRYSLLLVGVALAFVSGFLVRDRLLRNRDVVVGPTAYASGALADPVKAFWSNFLGNDPAPVIAYPDAVFLLDDWNDLFRYRRGASDDRGSIVDPHLAQQFASNPPLVAKAGELYYENGYTGAGELRGIAMLSNLFGQMGIKATIKPSHDVTPDDLRQHNVILIGSPFQNVAVAQLTNAADFKFDNPDTHHEQWRAQIINSHPHPNEASRFGTERDPTTRVLTADYSLVTIEPGLVPGRYIAILGGLDTTGTEGAILFTTSKPGIDELSKALGSSGTPSASDEMPLFQALVRVRLEKGYAVLGANLVALHRLSSSGVPGKANPSSQDSSH